MDYTPTNNWKVALGIDVNQIFLGKIGGAHLLWLICGTEPALQVNPNIFNRVKAGGLGSPLKKLNVGLFYLEHPILSMFSLV